MRPLQDQCTPTPYEDLQTLLLTDIGERLEDMFDEFDPKPLGVASLAQVHLARVKGNGQRVAVKLQHPHLAEFCDVDMKTVEVSLRQSEPSFCLYCTNWLRKGGSNVGSRSLSSLGSVKKCAKTCQKRWTSFMKPQMLNGRCVTLRI